MLAPAALERVVEDPVQQHQVVEDRLRSEALFLFRADERFQHFQVDLVQRRAAEERGEVHAQIALVVRQGGLLEAEGSLVLAVAGAGGRDVERTVNLVLHGSYTSCATAGAVHAAPGHFYMDKRILPFWLKQTG